MDIDDVLVEFPNSVEERRKVTTLLAGDDLLLAMLGLT